MRAILRKFFSFPVLLGALLVAGVFRGSVIYFVEGDTWWHITVGEHILRTAAWPTSDPYSFTVSGHPWIAYEWLGEVLMGLTARLGGLEALLGLLLVFSSTLLLLLYTYATLRTGNPKAAFLASALLFPIAVLFFILRPQLLGYLFLLITLICLQRFRQGQQKTLWVLPGLFLLWVNTHGSFAFGLLVLGLYWMSGLAGFRWGGLVAERWTALERRHLGVIFLLCLLVLPLTPYGTRLAAYPLELAFYQPHNIASIGEWQPLRFEVFWGKLFLGLLLLFLLAQIISRPTWRLEEMGLLLIAVYAASLHRRFLILFVLVFTPLLATLLARWISPYQSHKDRTAWNAALLVLMGGGLWAFFPSPEALEEMVARKFPREAVEYLRQHPVPGPLFNEYSWGGYLIWSLSGEQKVFIDGRADIYEYAGVLSDYLRISALHPDTRGLLGKYGIEACLLNRTAPLGTFLRALPDWEPAYQDEVSVLLVHKRSHPRAKLVSEKRGGASRGIRAHSIAPSQNGYSSLQLLP